MNIKCRNHLGEMVDVNIDKLKFRPSVYGIIRNKEGEICVCTVTDSNKMWFPGGGIDVGESRIKALFREIDEEAGLKNLKIKRELGCFENFFYDQPNDKAMHAYLWFYECETDDLKLKSNDQVDDDGATKDFKWIAIEEIRKEDLTDLNEEVFALLQSLNKN